MAGLGQEGGIGLEEFARMREELSSDSDEPMEESGSDSDGDD